MSSRGASRISRPIGAASVFSGGAGGLRVLAVPPHPDDETLTGLLPLRLSRELAVPVSVWTASYGSDLSRREERRRELERACGLLGWQLMGEGTMPAGADGLAAWLRRHSPALVVCPHSRDGHPRHRAAHRLAVAAADLAGVPVAFALTDYWMPDPRANCLVEASADHVSALQAALRAHAGEVARNDYDRRLPDWMSDNVRRAGEWIAGSGGRPPAFPFAVPYRIRVRRGGRWQAFSLRPPASFVARTSGVLSPLASLVSRLVAAFRRAGKDAGTMRAKGP